MQDMKAVSDPVRIEAMQRMCRRIHVSPPVRSYITGLWDAHAAIPLFDTARAPGDPSGS